MKAKRRQRRTRLARGAALTGVTGMLAAGVAVPPLAHADKAPVPTAHQVDDVTPGAGDTSIGEIVAWDDSAIFTVESGDSAGLWRVGDDQVPSPLLDSALFEGATVAHVTPVGDRLFFTASSGQQPGARGLWVTDGTEAGTEQLTAGNAFALAEVSGSLFFSDYDSVWKSDGTVAGTEEVAAVGQAGEFTAFGDEVVFAGQNPERTDAFTVWITDDSESGAHELTAHGSYEPARSFVAMGDRLFFDGYDFDGTELWSTDGTPEGTRLVKDLNTLQTQGSYPSPITSIDDRLVFRTTTLGAKKHDWWRSDDTAGGTKKFASFTSSTKYDATDAVVMAGRVYFSEQVDGVTQLLSTEGTAKSTKQVTSFGKRAKGVLDGAASDLVTAAGRVWFVAENKAHGRELWSTDGTVKGTRLVLDIRPGAASSGPQHLTAVGGSVLFAADDGVSGRELWRTGPDEDVAAPSVKAAAEQRQRHGRVAIKAKLGADESVTARVAGKIRIKGGEAHRLRSLTVGVARGVPSKVTVTVGKKAQAKVWKALAAYRKDGRKPVTAVLRVTFVDPAGNTVRQRREIALR